MAADRQREPGDDDEDVPERDEDGEELWPISRVLQWNRLTGATESVGGSIFDEDREHYAARVSIISHRDWLVRMDAHLEDAEIYSAKLLFRTREDYRQLARAGMTTPEDASWGVWLKEHVSKIKEARRLIAEAISECHRQLRDMFEEMNDHDDSYGG